MSLSLLRRITENQQRNDGIRASKAFSVTSESNGKVVMVLRSRSASLLLTALSSSRPISLRISDILNIDLATLGVGSNVLWSMGKAFSMFCLFKLVEIHLTSTGEYIQSFFIIPFAVEKVGYLVQTQASLEFIWRDSLAYFQRFLTCGFGLGHSILCFPY